MNRRSPLRALAALAPHAPRTVDAAIRAIARATYGRVGVTIDREDLRRLMPELSPGEADAVSRQAWLNHVRFLTLRPSRLRDRRDFVREALVDDGGLSRISGPAVLALIHTGPFFILEEALRRVPAPVAVLLMGDAPPGDGNLTFHTSVGDGHGMRAFSAGLATLKGGGFVVVGVDANPLSMLVPWFDRTIPLARGAFALSRIARAPIVPLVLRWEGCGGRVVLGDPIAPLASDQAGAEALIGWMEAYVRANPTALVHHHVATWAAKVPASQGAA